MHTHSLRSTERVKSISWPLWLGREISMYQKFARSKEGYPNKRNRTVTQRSQVGAIPYAC